jgi:hypothetical protein
MDTRHRNYSYVAWYNVTGSDSGFSFQSNGQSNWMGLIATMNAAIYKHDTQGGVMTITRAPWPTLYTKENILGVFGEFSIIDLVGGFFFPFVLFMLMPIIMSMVMYEKEYRLREVMKMMGLRMNVYWVVTYLLFLAEYSLLCTVFWVFGAMASKYSTALLLGTCVSIQLCPVCSVNYRSNEFFDVFADLFPLFSLSFHSFHCVRFCVQTSIFSPCTPRSCCFCTCFFGATI